MQEYTAEVNAPRLCSESCWLTYFEVGESLVFSLLSQEIATVQSNK